MKKYMVGVSSGTIIEAESEKQAIEIAGGLVEEIRNNPHTMPEECDNILGNLTVEDDAEELKDDDDEQLPEKIANDGSIACMYDHDHAQGGCEFHD